MVWGASCTENACNATNTCIIFSPCRWYAKRFMNPSIVAPYDYIFLWDQDLGVETFDAEEYIKIVKKHGLEISQPGLDITRGVKYYNITVRRNDTEIHT